MRIVRFSSAHLAGIDWIERERTKEIGFIRAFAAYDANPGWSLFDGDDFVAGGGIVIPYRGLGEAWIISGPLAQSHSLAVCRAARRGLEEFALGFGLVRIQAMVLRHHEAGCRFLEHLGFTQECLVRKYGLHGADMYLFAMFPGETSHA